MCLIIALRPKVYSCSFMCLTQKLKTEPLCLPKVSTFPLYLTFMLQRTTGGYALPHTKPFPIVPETPLLHSSTGRSGARYLFWFACCLDLELLCAAELSLTSKRMSVDYGSRKQIWSKGQKFQLWRENYHNLCRITVILTPDSDAPLTILPYHVFSPRDKASLGHNAQKSKKSNFDTKNTVIRVGYGIFWV